MKNFTLALLLVSFFSGMQAEAQQFIRLTAGKNTQINNMSVSYIAALRKSRKGEDYYRITVSVTNNGADYLQLFPRAVKTYVKTGHSALAYFQFVNATGRGFSATSGKLYARPLTMVVPFKCKKCPPPPPNSKKDPYNHYVSTYIIGTQFRNGSTLSHSYNIRVPQGVVPVVRVMVR